MDTPRELEWYLRDHFFRQSANRASFERSAIAPEMVSLYVRYRGYDASELSKAMDPVLDHLVSVQVLKEAQGMLQVNGKLARMQCAKCFYLNYLVEIEKQTCQRCGLSELHEFPKKK